MKTSLLGGALVVSLAANIYLFALVATRPSIDQPASNTPTTNAADSSNRGKTRIELLPRTRPTLDQMGGQPSGSISGDADRTSALEAELVKAKAEAQRNAPLSERFAHNTERSPEIEGQIRPTLDQVFPALPGGKPGYSVECHASICKLDIDPALEHSNWMADIQGEHRAPFGAMQLSLVEPTFLEVRSAESAAGIRYEKSVLASITSSPVVADCKQRFTDPGFVILKVVLDPDRQVRVTMTGRLADQPFGSCLRPVVEQASSQAPPLPAEVHSLPDYGVVVAPAHAEPSSEPTPRRIPREREPEPVNPLKERVTDVSDLPARRLAESPTQ